MISSLGWVCFDWDKLIHHSSGDISENVPSDQEGENTFVYLTSKSVSMCSQDSLSKEKYFAKYISLQKEMFFYQKHFITKRIKYILSKKNILTKNILSQNVLHQIHLFIKRNVLHKIHFIAKEDEVPKVQKVPT